MPLTLNGTTGIAGVDGSASTPSVQGSDTNTGVFFPAADTIAFTTNGTEDMRIDSSGNVGIGTSSPAYKLEINAGSNSYGVSFSATSAANSLLAFRDSSTTSIGPFVGSSGNNLTFGRGGVAEYMRIDSSGNVGIGASSPSTYSSAYRTVNAIKINDQVTTIGSYYQAGVAQYGFINSSDTTGTTAQPLVFSNGANVERARIDSSGNVGIGTASPSTKFNVIGDIHVGTSGNSARINNSGNDIVQFFAGRNGTNPYFYYNTSNSYGTTSDARSKNSIAELNTSDALAYVMKLKPSSFKMNGDEKYQAGFIAQNCLEASQNEEQKSAVAHYETYDEQDKDCPYLGVSDRPILAHAIAAIQELKSIIDAQAAEIAALKANAPA